MSLPIDLAVALMRKAANDLVAGDLVLASGRALDTVCFHAQQAVEKSLKAILTYHNVDYPRRHDLEELLHMVAQVAPRIEQVASKISPLTPYAVMARYATEFDPDLDVASQALQAAEDVFRFSLELLGLEDQVPPDWFLESDADSVP